MATRRKADPKKAVEKKIERNTVKNLEAALADERLAHVVLAKVFLETHGDPDKLLDRLELVVRNAVNDPKVKPRTRSAFIAAQQSVEKAVAIEMGKPQPLFKDSPDTGHVKPAEVKRLAEPPAAIQVGLDFSGSGGIGDAHGAHAEQTATIQRVQDHIVDLFRAKGSLTDKELVAAYMLEGKTPFQSAANLKRARQTLTTAGRLVNTGEKKKEGIQENPIWDLMERKALADINHH